MMKKNITVLCFFLQAISLCCANDVDSLLNVLDKTIAYPQLYTSIKQHRIDSLKGLLINANELDERYQLYHKMYKEYRNYNMDTAIIVANEKLEIATSIGNEEYIIYSKLNIAEILAIMGLYKEALEIANQTDRKKINKERLAYYYHVYHSTYSLIEQSSLSKNEKMHYAKLISLYKDSLLQANEPNTLVFDLVKNGKLVEQGQYQEALRIMLKCYAENQFNESQLGSIAYGLSDIYEKLGDRTQQKKYLIISSIADLRKASKSYISLRKLAILLYQEGDIDRAYDYIQRTIEDATFCKARFRTLEISEDLPIILAAYNNKMKDEKRSLLKYGIIISILSAILAVSIFLIYRQMKKLTAARQSIKAMYEQSQMMNEEIKKMNAELSQLNVQLTESNQVKETYIGSIFTLCSSYIDKMDAYRIDVNRKLRSGQIEEAVKLTGSTSLASEELKEFYRNFDAIFLSIYPNFVEQFNSLLKKEERIIPKGEDILTPELRVFALIRLGIGDSSKIATFFHYSPQTVYNYKLKIRNKVAIPKEDFSSLILKIGK